jgi:hypothetical protein
MRILKFLAFCLLFTSAVSAQALILTDVHSFNAPLINGKYTTFLFNFADYGYDHRTDTIKSVTLTFDFREIVETEEDPADWENLHNWEPLIIYSRIFDGRDIYGDIDTGILRYSTYWYKTYECQLMPWESDVCEENLDLDGIMSSTILSGSDNLWLGDVRASIDVNRVPEPAPVLLFGLGLLGLAIRNSFK